MSPFLGFEVALIEFALIEGPVIDGWL